MPFVAARVLLYEIAQHELERELARVITDGARLRDVVTDDGLDAALALGCVHEVVAELGRGDLRDVLVMRDGEHLVFREIAKGEAVFQAKHGRLANLSPLRRQLRPPPRRSRMPGR